MSVIEISKLCKYYSRDIKALDSLDLRVPSKKIYGFLGPNGAGKTTTIKILLGFIRNYQGKVAVFGEELNGNLVAIKQRIGYVPEGATLPKNLKVQSFLSATARIHGLSREATAEAIKDTLKVTGMSAYRNRKIGHMSKGQKQRISIANALVHSPELLILDEPTSGLDALSRGKLLNFIRNWSVDTGGSVFVSSHVLSEIDKICDQVAILNRGRLLARGSIYDIRGQFISPVYNIQAKNLDIKELEKVSHVINVQHGVNHNGSVKVEVDNLELGSLSLLHHFASKKIVVSRFSLEEPTLEAAFSKIVESDDGKMEVQ
ncbi:MAG: ATP-binding cassette domain-containing protein [Candidatus Odinarchaeota archaeon]